MGQVFFKYYDTFGREVIQHIDKRDVKSFKIALMEQSLYRNIGPLYIYRNDEWQELDYYNERI
jgi:hypothetical protein